MKTLVLLSALTLAACGPPDVLAQKQQRLSDRQQATNTAPGVHVTGHATFGVSGSF